MVMSLIGVIIAVLLMCVALGIGLVLHIRSSLDDNQSTHEYLSDMLDVLMSIERIMTDMRDSEHN